MFSYDICAVRCVQFEGTVRRSMHNLCYKRIRHCTRGSLYDYHWNGTFDPTFPWCGRVLDLYICTKMMEVFDILWYEARIYPIFSQGVLPALYSLADGPNPGLTSPIGQVSLARLFLYRETRCAACDWTLLLAWLCSCFSRPVFIREEVCHRLLARIPSLRLHLPRGCRSQQLNT